MHSDNSFQFEIPVHQSRHTLMAIGYGALLLAWLTPEDATLLIVSILGAGLSVLLVGLAVMRWMGGSRLSRYQWMVGFILFGAAAGFGAVLCTVFLMVFKNAWHSHAFLDFPGTVIVGITHRMIPWTVAGGLLGSSAVLIRLACL
ncbi:MAG TPA: hypothetical protein VJZ27_17245 [Aggregatilineales bacterium]|nr:hypothetical protein [Aggregatilineales bacterium]